MKIVLLTVLFLCLSFFAPDLVSAGQTRENEIREKNDTIKESKVTAFHTEKEKKTQTGHKKLDKIDFLYGNVIFSTPDLIKTIQNLPGVNSGTELMSGLYVHGGEGSDNLFLLDGVPLYQISHLGGLFSSFNMDVVKSVDFYKSGFPARYGGRLSSVVDVKTGEGDFEGYHGTFALGLIDGRLQFEGPIVKGKTSFNISFRRSWMDAVMVPTIKIVNKTMMQDGETVDGTYSFYDLNASVTHKFSDRNKLSVRAYHGRDHLRMSTNTPQTENGYSGTDILGTNLRWGNTLASLKWDFNILENLRKTTVFYYTSSISDIKYNLEDWKFDTKEHLDKVDEKSKSRVGDFALKTDFEWLPHKSHTLRLGASCIVHQYRPERETMTENDGFPIPSTYNDRYSATEAAVYAEDEMSLTGWMTLDVGLRYAIFFTKGKTWHSLEPRLAIDFYVSDFLRIKASYTEMSQFSHLVATTYMDLPTNCWLPSTSKIRPMRSRQVTAGLYTKLPLNFHLNLEGYYKTLENILEYSGKNSLFPPLDSWENSFSKGRGRAYGLETEFGWANPHLRFTAYYTLSWSKRRYDDLWYDWFSHRYDNRHKLTLMANWKISETVDVYANWNYHSGNLMTVPSHIYNPGETYDPIYTKPNNLQIPDYHRLDLGVNFNWASRNEKVRHMWNIGIYNVYCRKNIVFVTIKELDDKSIKGEGRAIFPIIPSFSYTLKF